MGFGSATLGFGQVRLDLDKTKGFGLWDWDVTTRLGLRQEQGFGHDYNGVWVRPHHLGFGQGFGQGKRNAKGLGRESGGHG